MREIRHYNLLMIDSRLNKMASVLVNYSLAVKPKQWVYVWGSSPVAEPLMLEIYREVLKAGGNAHLRADLPGAQEVFFATASGHQLDEVSPVDRLSVDEHGFDAYVRIGADLNTRRLANVNSASVTRVQTAMGPITARRMSRSAEGTYRWVVCRYPTNAYAMEADMSLTEYEEFVFDACLLNDADPVSKWKALGIKQQVYVDYLQTKKQLHVRGANVDLTMSIDGRKWKNSCGLRNFPDGEVYTGPVEDSVEGWIRYSYPAIYLSREVSGVQLWWEKGRVVKASASKNEGFLIKTLDTDVGARSLGEFAIGDNYGIKKFSKDILFDEKIGGTIHLAVGMGYPDTGSVNKSAVHWDMITGMEDAEIAADGDVFYKNGQFLI